MSLPNSEFLARQNPELAKQMDAEKFELAPDWSENEYALASKLWRIFKTNPGTMGKKMAIQEIRDYKNSN